MIRVRHIFVSHPPHEKRQVTIWPSLRSAKNVKKQQEVSDLNQDYTVPWTITVENVVISEMCYAIQLSLTGQVK